MPRMSTCGRRQQNVIYNKTMLASSTHKRSDATLTNLEATWNMMRNLGFTMEHFRNEKKIITLVNNWHRLTQKDGKPYHVSSLLMRLDNLNQVLRGHKIDDPKISPSGCECVDGNINPRCKNHHIRRKCDELKLKKTLVASKKLDRLATLSVTWDDYIKFCDKQEKIVTDFITYSKGADWYSDKTKRHEFEALHVGGGKTFRKVAIAFPHVFIRRMGAPMRLNYCAKIVTSLPSEIKEQESYLLCDDAFTPLTLHFNDKTSSKLGMGKRDVPEDFKPLLKRYIECVLSKPYNTGSDLFLEFLACKAMTNHDFGKNYVTKFKVEGKGLTQNDLRALYITMRYQDVSERREIEDRELEISREMRQRVEPKSLHYKHYCIPSIA